MSGLDHLRTFHISGVEELLAIVLKLNVSAGEALYRGQANVEWGLKASIFREPKGPVYESTRYIHFMNGAKTRHPDCPRAEDLFGWLLLMQHYGLQTRLLDWSESPLVATYFAVSESTPGDAVVYLLDSHAMNGFFGNQGSRLLPHHASVKHLVTAGFSGLPALDQVVALAVPEIDLRMMVQRSAFTIHGASSGLEECPGAEKFLFRMVIPSDKKPSIRKELVAVGIDHARIFPDLSGLARFLNEGQGICT
jgi:hypothetical protein